MSDASESLELQVARAAVSKERPAGGAPLGRSLDALGAALLAEGRPGESVEASQEAVGAYRDAPGEVRADLAVCLNNLAIRLRETGRHTEALVAAEEGLSVRSDLAAVRPEVYEPEQAVSLATIARIHEVAGDRERAQDYGRNALDTIWPHFEQSPARWAQKTGMILTDHLQRTSGQTEPGMMARAMAFSGLMGRVESPIPRRAMAAPRRGATGPILLNALHQLAEEEEGGALPLETLAEAVSFMRERAKDDPSAEPALANALEMHAGHMEASGQLSSARSARREALDLLWPHFNRSPSRHTDWTRTLLASALANEPLTRVLAQRVSDFERLTGESLD